MGAWGSGVFDNDVACDFALTAADGGGVSALEAALDRVLSLGDDYLKAPEAAEGLAAADVAARLRSSPGVENAYTARVDAWVRTAGATASGELAEKAARAIKRILTEPSELLELWEASDDFDGWKRAVEELTTRLQ
ncbi:MAG: DUF4259 domain-containing protein [Hyphomicrobium sp.]|jgi:hypothetical protein